MRVALFGGTFDPIHCGHLRVAAAAADAFALDRVLFAPTGRQPLKSESAVATFTDRIAMVCLALAGGCREPRSGEPQSGERTTNTGRPRPDPRFAVTSLDAPRPDGQPNYTVDLLAEIARTSPQDDLFAITGADSFLTLRNWRSPTQLLALAEWIVVSRPDFPLTPNFLDRAEFSLTPAQRARIHLLPGLHEDISATDLRNRLRINAATPSDTGAPNLDKWLPPAVAVYIREHHPYQ